MSDSPKVKDMIDQLKNPWKLAFFQFFRLPSLFFWRVRVQEIDRRKAIVTIPFNWWTQNPFRSIYFSALMGAAEFSTGVLALVATADRPNISMLVINVNTKFVKKATGKVSFYCDEGQIIENAIQKAVETKAGQTAEVLTIGKLESGEIVCESKITWSFKERSRSK